MERKLRQGAWEPVSGKANVLSCLPGALQSVTENHALMVEIQKQTRGAQKNDYNTTT